MKYGDGGMFMGARAMRYGQVALLAAALAMTACSDGGGASSAPVGASMFMGRYTAKTPVTAVMAMSGNVDDVEVPAEQHDFAMAEPGLMSGRPVAQWLSQLDADYSGDASGAGANTLQGAIRAALARWHASPNDMSTATGAGETVEKSLDVGRLLSVHTEVRAALTGIEAGRWDDARSHWDRAAAWFSTIEGDYSHRSDTTAPDIWGPGTTSVTDEDLGARNVDLLARGALLIDAHATANAADTARQLLVYSTKYAFLSALNYATVYASRVSAMGDLEYPRAEGGALFEGVVQPFHARAMPGSATAMMMSAARARWAFGVTAAQGPTRLAVLHDSAALYGTLTADGVTGYAAASEGARAATRSTLRGVVDTLDEALAYAHHEPAPLRDAITAAEARSAAGDHAGAATLLATVQSAIDAVAHAE